MNPRSGSEEFDMNTISLFRIQNPNLIRIDPSPSLQDEWMLLCGSCAACLWNVCDLLWRWWTQITGLWLATTDQLTSILASYWSICRHKVVSLADRVQRWTDDPDFSPLPHILKSANSGPALANQKPWSARHWPIRGPDGHRVPHISMQICHARADPDIRAGWPKHNKTQIRRRKHISYGFPDPFRPKLNLSWM